MQGFTSVLVLTIFFIVYVITDINSYKQRKIHSITSLASVIGNNSISTLEFQDDDEATKILFELKNVAPEIIQAAIMDKNGKLFARYLKPGTDSTLLTSVVNNNKAVFHGGYLFASNDIISKNEIIGKVLLVAGLSELQQIKQAKFRIGAILLVMALGFSFLVAYILQPYISKRLLYLVDSIKEVSISGNYEQRLEDNGKDEISILINVFNNLMEQVKLNQRRKDEFIGIASHELKTPITSIKGYIELLNVIEDKQPNKQFVIKALENVKKLETLISDLLDVSKIQSGQLELNLSKFNIEDLLEETITAIRVVSGSHEIIQQHNLHHEIILADRQRIEQVLVNLLSNAIKYSPGEKKIIISTAKTGKEIIIKIRDFGIGVPKEEQLNIFERFYRTKDTSANISGFGLGLYICMDIIKRHQGKLWVEAEEKGSSFYFSLPLE